MKSRSSGAKTFLAISGNCDGGTLKLSKSLNSRNGTFRLKGYLGRTQVDLVGYVGSHSSFEGRLDRAYVDIGGIGSRNFCDLDGSIGGEYQSLQSGSMFGRLCPMLNGLLR